MAVALANPKGEVVLCQGCGADTRDKTGLCENCSPRRHNAVTHQADPQARLWVTPASTPSPDELLDAMANA